MGKKVTLGVIGLGCRGFSLLKDVFAQHEDVEFAGCSAMSMRIAARKQPRPSRKQAVPVR